MKIKRISCISVLILLFTATIFGQGISERLCKDIDVSLVQSLKPVKIYRQDVFKNDCVFEFVIPEKNNVYISVEKYKTEKESAEDLKGSLSLLLAYNNIAETPKFSRVKLDTKEQWDENFFYKSDYNDNFILLRKSNFNITMISNSHEILAKLEERLRKISFEE